MDVPSLVDAAAAGTPRSRGTDDPAGRPTLALEESAARQASTLRRRPGRALVRKALIAAEWHPIAAALNAAAGRTNRRGAVEERKRWQDFRLLRHRDATRLDDTRHHGRAVLAGGAVERGFGAVSGNGHCTSPSGCVGCSANIVIGREPCDKERKLLGHIDAHRTLVDDVGCPIGEGEDDIDNLPRPAHRRGPYVHRAQRGVSRLRFGDRGIERRIAHRQIV